MSRLGKAAIGVLASYSSCVFMNNERANTEVRAKSEIKGKDIEGVFEFIQTRYTENTEIKGEVRGLLPDHKHGVQIHVGSEENVGEIYNPFGKKHGGPWNPERKVGDLGNLQADNLGNGKFTASDPYLKLSGPFSILSKIVTVHENPDDLGFGRQEKSLLDGGVGKTLAYGVISSN